MYKIKNNYKDCHIMDLNLMGIQEYKHFYINKTEILLLCTPIIAALIFIAYSLMPELGFFAECQNIAGGDVCNITFK